MKQLALLAETETETCEWCKGEVSVDAGPCPLSFECPTCHAAPGHWCKRPSEHRAPQLHVARRDLEFD